MEGQLFGYFGVAANRSALPLSDIRIMYIMSNTKAADFARLLWHVRQNRYYADIETSSVIHRRSIRLEPSTRY
jgi:hypothetical protein